LTALGVAQCDLVISRSLTMDIFSFFQFIIFEHLVSTSLVEQSR